MTATLPLTALRLHPAAEADLVWYFLSAECALGLRSNLGAQLERLRANPGRNSGTKPLGRATSDGDMTDQRIEAAMRVRRIELQLEQLPRKHKRALQAYYAPASVLMPHQAGELEGTYGAWGALAFVLARNDVARRELREDGVLAKRKSPEGVLAGKRVQARRLAAEVALVEACAAWRSAR